MPSPRVELGRTDYKSVIIPFNYKGKNHHTFYLTLTTYSHINIIKYQQSYRTSSLCLELHNSFREKPRDLVHIALVVSVQHINI